MKLKKNYFYYSLLKYYMKTWTFSSFKNFALKEIHRVGLLSFLGWFDHAESESEVRFAGSNLVFPENCGKTDNLGGGHGKKASWKKYCLVRKSNQPFLVLKGVTERSFLNLKRDSGNSEEN